MSNREAIRPEEGRLKIPVTAIRPVNITDKNVSNRIRPAIIRPDPRITAVCMLRVFH